MINPFGGGSMETLIIKWSLGFAFLFVTVIFAGKVIALLILVAKLKMLALKAWVLSPDFMSEFGRALWDAIWKGK
jgi:hypothetical protein